ncbi:unnamed protein product [Sphacelaria rigidula]
MELDSLGIGGVPIGLSDDVVATADGTVEDGDGEKTGQIPEELLRPSYLLLEPVRYTLAEILRLCRRPMVLPGPLVRSLLQDLLGAVAVCHDHNVVIKAIDAEKVFLNSNGSLKLGCLAQAMMVNSKDSGSAGAAGAKGDGQGNVNMDVEQTSAGRKAAHKEGKLKLKKEKLARENASKKAVAAIQKEGEPAKTVLWGMAPEVLVDHKHPHGPATDIWAVGCLAAQLALGKPIFGGRTRAQQLEYVFKCCGSPGQGRWPEGNKAPLYRHLRPTDKEGKSLHFKPRLSKVLSAEGNKGVPLDPELCDLLQGLLKLDSRHRLSARDALASPYFTPRPRAIDERVDAWNTLRGDLDKVQMGVATPDQLRGTYAAAAATASTTPRGLVAPSPSPPPPPPRENRHLHDPNGHGHEGLPGRVPSPRVPSPSPPPPPPRNGALSQAIELPLPVAGAPVPAVDMNSNIGGGGGGGGSGYNRDQSPSPRGGRRRRSPANGRSSRDRDSRGRENNYRDRERERDGRERDRKRKRDRERERDKGRDRSRSERSGKEHRRTSRADSGHRHR